MDQTIEVEVSAGLSAETEILDMENIRLTNIRSIFLLRSGKNIDSIGFDEHVNIVNNTIINVPQEIFTKDFCDIGFSNGVNISVTPGTMIFTLDGWKHAGEIKKGEKILGATFTMDTTNDTPIIPQSVEITTYNRRISALSEPCYLVMTSNHNLLIPHYIENENKMTFICIHE